MNIQNKRVGIILGFFTLIILSLSISYWQFVIRHNYTITYDGGETFIQASTLTEPALCENLEPSKWLLFGPNVPTVVYYTHLIPIFFSILLAFFIISRRQKNRAHYILFSIVVSFIVWVLADLSFWATNRSDSIMFIWVTDIIVETLIYGGGLYLLYVLIDKKDMPLFQMFILLFIWIPTIALQPTTLNIIGFDLSSCLPFEGPIALYYGYFAEIIVTLWIFGLGVARYQLAETPEKKQEIVYLSAGILFLLIAFSSSNIIGSVTGNWDGYGLFGLPVFAGILFYSIVRFKTFDIKILTSVALIIALMILFALGIFI